MKDKEVMTIEGILRRVEKTNGGLFAITDKEHEFLESQGIKLVIKAEERYSLGLRWREGTYVER